MVDWSDSNQHWGQVGHNVTEAANGSWVGAEGGEDQ